MNARILSFLAVVATGALALAGCGGVSSDEQARRAYLGLDRAIEKALKLGFDGFNAATSANIPEQSTSGDETGTLRVTGQVDQGASVNKEMRLRVGLANYSDGEIELGDGETIQITYNTAGTPDAQPALDVSLRNIPNGTLTGTLVGDFDMTGDVEDTVTLDLSLSGSIEDDGSGGTRRVAGSTHVTGTATSAGGGEYAVDVTL